MLIAIEGQDATGKDLQAKMLADYLREKGEKVTTYAESGTNSPNKFVNSIAKLNYGSVNDIDERTRVLLYLVNRYEQWKKYAEPTLKSSGTVIITRYWFSTLIYEGYGLGVSKSLITRLHHEVMPEAYFKPNHLIILTLNDEERAKRLVAQGERKVEFFKSKEYDFQQKLNRAYLKVAKDFNVETFDAAGTPDEVHQRLIKKLGV